MKVWISDNSNKIKAVLELEPGCDQCPKLVCLEGDLPDGLVLQDLTRLGTVSYVVGARGRPVPRICRVEPSENLEYVRALVEAMPPGYYVSKVESEKIEELRQEKALLFFEEFERMADSGGRGDPS